MDWSLGTAAGRGPLLGLGDTRNISPLLWCQCRIAELLLSSSGHHNDGARQVSADLSSIQTVHALVVSSPVQGRPWRLVQAGQSGGQGTFCRCNDFMLISIIMITATLLGLATTVWPLPRDGMAASVTVLLYPVFA